VQIFVPQLVLFFTRQFLSVEPFLKRSLIPDTNVELNAAILLGGGAGVDGFLDEWYDMVSSL
jgi:hypothetical protein